MYGLVDDIQELQQDIRDLQAIIASLLPCAPAETRKLVIMALKAKNLLPEGITE
jgi:hypothetical protein